MGNGPSEIDWESAPTSVKVQVLPSEIETTTVTVKVLEPSNSTDELYARVRPVVDSSTITADDRLEASMRIQTEATLEELVRRGLRTRVPTADGTVAYAPVKKADGTVTYAPVKKARASRKSTVK